MSTESGMKPRFLLVEDDPPTRIYLREIATMLPAKVDVASTCAQAARMARKRSYDLWLFDANLPDGSGAGLYQQLLADPEVGKRAPVAIAHTAEIDMDYLDKLCACGFKEVVRKPITPAGWLGALRRGLGLQAASIEDLEEWDDDHAIRALGDFSNVDKLRTLFVSELPEMQSKARVAVQEGDDTALRDVLHRLKASCSLVGAKRLLESVRTLSADRSCPKAFAAMDEAFEVTLATFRTTGSA
ncbi:response regulator [Lysobacter sp. HDW10]|uniref:Hpt domain-containing response regulator n=1 Tax=Lysobacter sp. HDW10 TaxID=2714936 RepID=UPI001408C9F3|nr:response regulator [Lysobacter sp. HDW10]QIK81785.1 response regulator [Lysobacter sp. HDW10]